MVQEGLPLHHAVEYFAPLDIITKLYDFKES